MNGDKTYSLDEIKEILAHRGLPTDIEELHDLDTFVEGFHLFQASRYLEAIEIFSTLLHSERHGLIRTYLGACHYRLDNSEAAFRHFSYLAKHDQGRIQIVASSMLANLQIEHGSFDEAIDLLQHLPPHPYNLLDLCICYTRKGRQEQKPEFIQKAIALLETVSFDNLEQRGIYNYHHLKAVHSHYAFDLDTAQIHFKKALHLVQRDQDKGKLMNDYALLQLDRERYEEAATLILTAREFSKTPLDAEEIFVKCLHEKGVQLFHDQKFFEAIELFLLVLQLQDYSLSRYFLAKAYFRLERYESGYKHFGLLSQIEDPALRELAIASMVAIEIQWGQYDTAIQNLLVLPEKTWNLINLGLLYWGKYEQQRDPALIAQIKALLEKLQISSVDKTFLQPTYHLKGLICQVEKDYPSAEEYFKKSMALINNESKRQKGLKDLITLYIESDKYKEAIALFPELKAGDDKRRLEDILLDNMLQNGLQHYQEEAYQEAIEFFVMILAVRDDYRARQHLGLCYYHLEQYDLAYGHLLHVTQHANGEIQEAASTILVAIDIYREHFEEAIEHLRKLPETIESKISLCFIYWSQYKKNQTKERYHAMQKLLRSLDLASLEHISCRSHHFLALIYQEQKDYKLSQVHYEKALKGVHHDTEYRSLLSDYASLCLELENFEEASKYLLMAREYGKDKHHTIEDSFIDRMLKKGKELFEQNRFHEAMEIFLMVLGLQEHHIARKYLGTCHFYLERYEVAFKHFNYLAEYAEGKTRDYAVSMVAVIDILWGNYAKAIKALKSLPPTAGNQINLCILYWKKYREENDELAIRDALNILNKLNVDDLETSYLQNVNHIKALIYQAQKIPSLADDHYKKALTLAEEDHLAKGRILNDYASLLIDLKQYAEAESILVTARHFVEGKSAIEEAANNKWLGIIAMQRDEYEKAKEYLEKAAKVIKEKGLLEEVAIVNFLLAKVYRKNDFYKAADYYADGVVFERLAETFKTRDDKLFTLYLSHFDEQDERKVQ